LQRIDGAPPFAADRPAESSPMSAVGSKRGLPAIHLSAGLTVGLSAKSGFTRALVDPELAEDRRDVIARGPLADPEPQTDRPIVESLGDELENLMLARGEFPADGD
jgi:hypothetical protein